LALLLNIDTSTDIASVCFSDHQHSLGILENPHQKEHASFVHVAIEQLTKSTGKSLQEIDAIAVANGPGSYTGLRVGLATAKGLCYALGKPLITISTLQMMTIAAIQFADEQELNTDLFCPMIDARRMEVFTAMYNRNLQEVLSPSAMVLDSSSYDKWMTNNKVLFFGSGSSKFQPVLQSSNGVFKEVSFNASHLATLASEAFEKNEFADVAYAQPDYLKEFFTPIPLTKY
jgi:tRNA threonylcarbamoyladenosine biosynthesis protein TsaB